MQPLDNPIWNALDSAQAAFARRSDRAVCFQRGVTALAALREPTSAALDELATLLQPAERTGLFLERGMDFGGALKLVAEDELLQMTHEGPSPPANEDGLVELGAPDRPAMRALAEATQPG